MQYYDKIAHLYNIMYRKETGIDHVAQVQWVDQRREKLGLPKTVLDLACGPGRHLACFAELGYTCSGIDASQAMFATVACRVSDILLLQGFFMHSNFPSQFRSSPASLTPCNTIARWMSFVPR